MIKISFSYDKDKIHLAEIQIEGHDLVNEKESPVCAAVSAIVLGALNVLKSKNFPVAEVQWQKINNKVIIKNFAKNDFVNSLMLTIYGQLKTVKKYYSAKIAFQPISQK